MAGGSPPGNLAECRAVSRFAVRRSAGYGSTVGTWQVIATARGVMIRLIDHDSNQLLSQQIATLEAIEPFPIGKIPWLQQGRFSSASQTGMVSQIAQRTVSRN